MTQTTTESLLDTAWAQWRAGEWESLAQLEQETIEKEEGRAELALLAGAALFQLGKNEAAKARIVQARSWGAGKRLVGEVLVGGVHNTLGRIHLVNNQEKSALEYFGRSIGAFATDADRQLMSEARAVSQAVQLGLLKQAATRVSAQLGQAKAEGGKNEARLKILETEVELLHHELSLAQQRQQLFGSNNVVVAGAPLGSEAWKAQLKQKSVSQLGQDLWVLEKTGYKRGGYFVEFGATDGVLLSNSWLLEKEFAWKGICAEPNPKFFAQLQKNRQCIVSDQCIGGETGKEVEFIFADAYGGSQEYASDDQHKDKREAYRAAGQTATLTTISLHDFLLEHGAPKDIDYLSIDTEGSEYEILKAFPFEKWNIRLLTVEHNFTERRKDIRKLLEGYGYRCHEAQWDDWYELIDNAMSVNIPFIQANYDNYAQNVRNMREKYSIYPRNVSIETLVRCNAKCGFCPYPTSPRKGETISDELFLKLINDLSEIPTDHSFGITLTRISEPLLDRRQEKFAQIIAENLPSARQQFWTNGTMLKPGRFEWMTEYKGASLTVSLNSIHEEEHQELMGFGLKAVFKGLDYLHDLVLSGRFNLPVSLCAPFISDNQAQEFTEFTKARWPRFKASVRPFFEWTGTSSKGADKRNLSPVDGKKMSSDFPCAQWFDIHVLANGYLTKCCIDETGFIGDENFNVAKNNLLHLYQINSLKETLPNRMHVSECKNCTHLG
ncbi:FkbM family methyltransferase [Ectothiorhodospira lacustris]|uniref:FkbM family methyltransferase n=1 Tax=Ectothiorhodospira lacustris TaxID=2899127 RepID=UPI001EE7FF1E|nr:FkbM family methyltransferase [Ectothiorhodospira lacustris]MCG5510660.1 FkbM family methyltransferase [Ectothiorhodospira lacustris]MCG5522440.1 FkbM family methyltransferase [Ectothiorhodospira lacustris]